MVYFDIKPTQLTTLQYFTPPKAPDRWRGALLVWLFGPLTGAAIGIAQTSSALLCWLANGKPDFYFRGWSGVDFSYEMWTVGGAIVGWFFGLTLMGFERLFRRRIRLAIALPVSVVFGFAIGLGIVAAEFHVHEIRWPFWMEGGAVVMAWVVSAVCSRGVIALPAEDVTTQPMGGRPMPP
jgi:hypothetical protein